MWKTGTQDLPLLVSLPSSIPPGIRTHVLLSTELQQVEIVWISAGFSTELPPVPLLGSAANGKQRSAVDAVACVCEQLAACNGLTMAMDWQD
jgi:hypothetical protein